MDDWQTLGRMDYWQTLGRMFWNIVFGTMVSLSAQAEGQKDNVQVHQITNRIVKLPLGIWEHSRKNQRVLRLLRTGLRCLLSKNWKFLIFALP